VSSTLLDPQVIDASTLVPKATSAIYLPIAVEGQADNAGDAVVGVLYSLARVDEATARFGPVAPLTRIVQAILERGAGPVIAVASAKGATPTLLQRQSAWQALESDERVRIRLTDSEVQADVSALAVSAAAANLLFHKQIAIVGLAAGTTKANLLTAADSIATGGTEAATRSMLVAPGVYDQNGTLRGGSYLAAVYAAEIAKNSDPSNDLDLWNLPLLTGVELGATGLPLFRRQVVAGVAVNDYEDLQQGGVSPAQPSRTPGGVTTTHLRTTFQTNGTFDNLYTRIIEDQIFIDVKDYIFTNNFFRAGNTATTRARIKSGVEAILTERSSWIQTVTQPDGSQGYNVTVTPSADQRQVIIGYEGVVVRGISTVQVAANLTITV
jgi:hypothetical protein